MPKMGPKDDLIKTFRTYWDVKRTEAFENLCESEGLKKEKILKVIDQFLFTGHNPHSDDIVSSLQIKPKILDRKSIIKRVTEKILAFIKTFEDDIGDV